MATQKARSPRDGSKINLQSLHARYNQVTQIIVCLRISIESEAESVEPASVCRAVVDMLEDINSDLWTFLEPALLHKAESRAAREAVLLRKRPHAGIDDSYRGTSPLHHDQGSANDLHHEPRGSTNGLHHESRGRNGLQHDPLGAHGLHHDLGRNGLDHDGRTHDGTGTDIAMSEDVAH